METFIKCNHCGHIEMHTAPIALPGGDLRYYHCRSCKKRGNVRVLRGAAGMFKEA